MSKHHKDLEFQLEDAGGQTRTFKDFAGESGVEQYNEDPEASVFSRIVIRAEDQGRVA